MTTVAFPTGLYLERDSAFTFNTNTQVDYLADGSARVRVKGTDQYVTIECNFKNMFTADKDTLTAFLSTNCSNTITWTIDGTNYSGVFVGPYKLTMTGILFNVSFVYYATEV